MPPHRICAQLPGIAAPGREDPALEGVLHQRGREVSVGRQHAKDRERMVHAPRARAGHAHLEPLARLGRQLSAAREGQRQVGVVLGWWEEPHAPGRGNPVDLGHVAHVVCRRHVEPGHVGGLHALAPAEPGEGLGAHRVGIAAERVGRHAGRAAGVSPTVDSHHGVGGRGKRRDERG